MFWRPHLLLEDTRPAPAASRCRRTRGRCRRATGDAIRRRARPWRRGAGSRPAGPRGCGAHGDVGEAGIRSAAAAKPRGCRGSGPRRRSRSGRRDDVGQAGAVRADDDGRERELRQLAPRAPGAAPRRRRASRGPPGAAPPPPSWLAMARVPVRRRTRTSTGLAAARSASAPSACRSARINRATSAASTRRASAAVRWLHAAGAGTSAAANGPGAVVTRLRGAPRSPSSATIAGRVWVRVVPRGGVRGVAPRRAARGGSTPTAPCAPRAGPGAVTRTSAAGGDGVPGSGPSGSGCRAGSGRRRRRRPGRRRLRPALMVSRRQRRERRRVGRRLRPGAAGAREERSPGRSTRARRRRARPRPAPRRPARRRRLRAVPTEASPRRPSTRWPRGARHAPVAASQLHARHASAAARTAARARVRGPGRARVRVRGAPRPRAGRPRARRRTSPPAGAPGCRRPAARRPAPPLQPRRVPPSRRACDRSHRREQRATGVRPSPPDPATVAAAGGGIDTQVNARAGWPSPCAYRHAVAAEATGARDQQRASTTTASSCAMHAMPHEGQR